MTAQELYQLYVDANRATLNCNVETWDELTVEERAVWLYMAGHLDSDPVPV